MENQYDARSARPVMAVEEQLAIDRVRALYENLFQIKFNRKPVIVAEDEDVIRWLVRNFAKEVDGVIKTYLQYNDEWVSKKAYPFSWLKKNINEVLASAAKMGKIDREVFVVSITKDGEPVTSYNANDMGTKYWFKPVPLDDWMNQTNEERIQHSQDKFKDDPVSEWFYKWDEERKRVSMPQS